jgi:hypothetical protein
MTDDAKPLICRQVWDRAVESNSGRDVMEDAAFAAHVGSCMTCFRTLAELRDVPRVAAALRADAPAVPVSDRFWDDLAARTTAAVSAELVGPRKRRVWRVTGVAAIVAAAAAAWVLVAGNNTPVGSAAGVPGRAPAVAAGYDDEGGEEPVDVADLDETALRQLLQQLRARAPAHVGALAAVGDGQDVADSSFDDDVNDELAELDGAALLRLERSLAGASL